MSDQYTKRELKDMLIGMQDRYIRSTITTTATERRMSEMEDSIDALSDLVSRLNIKLGELDPTHGHTRSWWKTNDSPVKTST